MLTHTCEGHLRNTCEWHLIPANDTCEWRAFKSNESAYKGVQLHISTKESDREKMSIRLALRATQEEAVHSTSELFIRSVGIPNDSHFLVLIRHFTKTGVLWLLLDWSWQLASKNYTNGRSTSTGTGAPYERQRAFVRVFSGNFIMTRTVHIYTHSVNVLHAGAVTGCGKSLAK